MVVYSTFIAVCFISCLQLALCSYLGYPRIHFSGQFRTDTNTRNNIRCNFRLNKPLDPDLNDDWGFNGTEEFQFYNTYITSVVNKTGHLSTGDAIVGQNIIGNLRRPFAKLTDLDVDAQMHSTIYGLEFGIKWSDDFPVKSDIAFLGKWTPSVIAQSIWPRLKCYNMTNNGSELFQDSFNLGAQSSTIIKDVNWINFQNSEALTQLREAAGMNGNLTVRITLYYYTRNYPPYVARNATLGYVIGVIGVPSSSDTLNVPGERAMFATTNIPAGMTFNTSDLCYHQDLSSYLPWMFNAPFEVDTSRNEVHLDLSNSLPSNLNNSLRNIGTLRLGIHKVSDSCVHLLGPDFGIPYASDHNLPITSGIYTISIASSLMTKVTSSPLVVVQIVDDEQGTNTIQICGDSIFSTGSTHSALILLNELEYFVRPKGYYVDRLDRESASSIQTLFVTRYGEPVPRISVRVERTGDSVIPANGIVPSSLTATTDNDGFATFQFNVQDTIPEKREYSAAQCNNTGPTNFLPIDGQVYLFSYCIDSSQETSRCWSEQYGITFAFLAFSDVTYNSTPTWVNDVSPILSLFARLAPIMKTILDLSSYTEVTKPHNINILNLTLRLEFDHPSYMPTTRNLSPTKRNMILQWLENPRYNLSNSVEVEEDIPICMPPDSSFAQTRSSEYFTPPRCSTKQLGFDEAPQERDTYFDNIYDQFPGSMHSTCICTLSDNDNNIAILGRPLFGLVHNMATVALLCNRENIMTQLQTAIQLEWATIPTYLTSLYSIVDNCNTEIYNLIRSVVIQEMLSRPTYSLP